MFFHRTGADVRTVRKRRRHIVLQPEIGEFAYDDFCARNPT